MEISILADSSAKIAFPRNAQNGPESRGFWQESVEDSKDLGTLVFCYLFFLFLNFLFSVL